MGFFDDSDSFEDMVRGFLGNQNPSSNGFVRHDQNSVIQGEADEREIDFIETKKDLFLVFELPGYNDKDIQVEVNGNELIIAAKKKNIEGVQEYLVKKLRQGTIIKKTLPKFIKPKKYDFNFKNGILEVRFDKK
jgi:HSP20 family molecular chaperone IbpA